MAATPEGQAVSEPETEVSGITGVTSPVAH